MIINLLFVLKGFDYYRQRQPTGGDRSQPSCFNACHMWCVSLPALWKSNREGESLRDFKLHRRHYTDRHPSEWMRQTEGVEIKLPCGAPFIAFIVWAPAGALFMIMRSSNGRTNSITSREDGSQGESWKSANWLTIIRALQFKGCTIIITSSITQIWHLLSG